MINIREVVGKNIKKARISACLSQESLAEISGLHRTYISSVERGERNISIENLYKISNALDIHIKDLFE